MTTLRTLGVCAAVASLALGGCNTLSNVGNPFQGKNKPSAAAQGNRISIVGVDQELKPADALKGQDFSLPEATTIADWPLPGGTPEQSVEHAAAAHDFAVAWRKNFGAGSSRKFHVTAPPVAAGGKIFVMDGGATVSARDAQTGNQLWRVNLTPKSKRDSEAFGGGLAFAGGKIYVASGFRQVVQVDAATGAVGWRVRTEAPVHAAPMVYGGRVFVIDVNDEMMAFDAATGQQDWTYQALTEPARILQASSPAASGDTVIGAFASGELVALRAANGNELWNASLSRASRTNALSEIRDIVGRPVIYKNDVYAVSHSNVMAATDLRTGAPRWTLPVSATTTPWPAGDVVYVIDQSGQVICISRESGQVYWIHELNAQPVVKKGKKAKTSKHRVYWSSPILASNRLITVSTTGEAVALNAKTGAVERTIKIGDDALIGPIAVGNMVYVATQGAELVAIR